MQGLRFHFGLQTSETVRGGVVAGVSEEQVYGCLCFRGFGFRVHVGVEALYPKLFVALV